MSILVKERCQSPLSGFVCLGCLVRPGGTLVFGKLKRLQYFDYSNYYVISRFTTRVMELEVYYGEIDGYDCRHF